MRKTRTITPSEMRVINRSAVLDLVRSGLEDFQQSFFDRVASGLVLPGPMGVAPKSSERLPSNFAIQNKWADKIITNPAHSLTRHSTLAKFKGDGKFPSWPVFWDTFYARIHAYDPSIVPDSEKLACLRILTVGDAQVTVDKYLQQTNNDRRYEDAVSALHVKYGQIYSSKNQTLQKLRALKPIRDNLASMQDFTDTLFTI